MHLANKIILVLMVKKGWPLVAPNLPTIKKSNGYEW
jgi:hypothetical protein